MNQPNPTPPRAAKPAARAPWAAVGLLLVAPSWVLAAAPPIEMHASETLGADASEERDSIAAFLCDVAALFGFGDVRVTLRETVRALSRLGGMSFRIVPSSFCCGTWAQLRGLLETVEREGDGLRVTELLAERALEENALAGPAWHFQATITRERAAQDRAPRRPSDPEGLPSAWVGAVRVLRWIESASTPLPIEVLGLRSRGVALSPPEMSDIEVRALVWMPYHGAATTAALDGLASEMAEDGSCFGADIAGWIPVGAHAVLAELVVRTRVGQLPLGVPRSVVTPVPKAGAR